MRLIAVPTNARTCSPRDVHLLREARPPAGMRSVGDTGRLAMRRELRRRRRCRGLTHLQGLLDSFIIVTAEDGRVQSPGQPGISEPMPSRCCVLAPARGSLRNMSNESPHHVVLLDPQRAAAGCSR